MKDWVEGISKITALIGAYLFFLIGLIIAYEVIARYVFNQPTIWVEESARLLQLWACYLSMAWLLKKRKLIRINVLLVRLRGKLAKVAELLSVAVIGVFSLFAIYYSSILVADSIEVNRHTSSMLGLPAWWFELSIVFGFTLLFLQCCIEAYQVCTQTHVSFHQEHDI